MKLNLYLLISGIFFFLVAVGHLLRALFWTPMIFGTTEIPMWPSWVAIVVTGFLAYTAFKLRSKVE